MLRLAILSLMAASVALSVALPAFAIESVPSRYQFVPVERGALRLDTETGEVAYCSDEGGSVSCSPASQGSRIEGTDLARLEARVAALEERIASLTGSDRNALPDDATMDRVMLLTERMMRRLFALVQEMKRETEDDRL